MPRPYNTCDSEQEVLAAAGEVTQNQWVAACRDRTTSATPSRSYLPQRKKLRKTNGSRHAATVQHLQLLAEVLAAAGEVTQTNGSRHAATVQHLQFLAEVTCRSGRSYGKPTSRGMPRPYNPCFLRPFPFRSIHTLCKPFKPHIYNYV